MKKLYNCYFLSRSGSHAIRDWICNQIEYVEKKQGHHHFVMITEYDDIMIENYERDRIKFEHKSLLDRKKKVLGDDRSERDKCAIIILRDPFNLFASWSYNRILQKLKIKEIKNFADIWKEHAREFLGDTDNFNSKICISYNKWFVSVEYRKELCDKFGMKFTDEGKNKLSLSGNGSSFNGMDKRFRKHADRLDTLNRWKVFLIEDKYDSYKKNFMEVFKDHELISLSKRIFGQIEGTEVLFQK